MLQDVMDDGTTGGRTPVRPSSAPPGRGRRPQANQLASPPTGAGEAPTTPEGRDTPNGNAGSGDESAAGDESTSAGDSRDLRGFDELERTDFSYDEYPVTNSPEEVEWVHVPWHGTNSGDILVPDDPPQPHLRPILGPPGSSPSNDGVTTPQHGCADGEAIVDSATRLAAAAVDKRFTPVTNSLAAPSPDGENKGRQNARNDEREQRLPVGLEEECSREKEAGGGGGTGSADRVASRRPVSDGGLIRYDWDATKIPVRPALSANSRIPSGSRAEKIKAKNARKRNPNKKVGIVHALRHEI